MQRSTSHSTGIVNQRDRGHASATYAAPGAAHHLIVEDGADLITMPLLADVVHIGRSTASDLTLDDATVSGRHAVVVRQGDGWRILDDRSLNGVVVCGRRVSGAALRDGDVIELGRVRLHYVCARDPAAGNGTEVMRFEREDP